MKAYTRGERCLMQLLTESLDDPQAASCGQCSVCLGQTPDGLGLPASAELMQMVAATLRTDSTVLEPRKIWPGGEFGTRGKIPAGLLAEPGRVLVHADAPEWSGVIAAAVTGEPEAIEVLTQAVVSTLARWRDEWVARPEIAVSLQLTGTPNPVRPVTERIATIGRLQQAAMPAVVGMAPGRDSSGGEEATYWRDAISTDDSLRDMVNGRCVLLVADSTSTRWPITVAAAHLRKAGARAVLPLLIHQPA